MPTPAPDPARRRRRVRRAPPTRSAAAALVLALAVTAALTTAGCRSGAPPPAPPALTQPSRLPAADAPSPAPPANPLAEADRAYTAGDFAAATAAYEGYVTGSPAGAAADRALLQLALLYTLPDSSVADPAKGRARLRTLVERFPVSPYAPQARTVLALMDEIDRLRGDLQRQKKSADELKKDLEALKRIDLQGQKPPG